jgi:hypothetical protein
VANAPRSIGMPAEVKKEIELEIAHVLFLDIVGYSKLSVNEQHGRVDELNGIVRLSEQSQKAEAAIGSAPMSSAANRRRCLSALKIACASEEPLLCKRFVADFC